MNIDNILHDKLADLTSSRAIHSGLGHSINQAVLARVTAFISKVQDKGKKSQHDEL